MPKSSFRALPLALAAGLVVTFTTGSALAEQTGSGFAVEGNSALGAVQPEIAALPEVPQPVVIEPALPETAVVEQPAPATTSKRRNKSERPAQRHEDRSAQDPIAAITDPADAITDPSSEF
ncbi:MAG: hypothetical protein AAGD12_02885 [Pseudomonadota bacterium]